MIDINNLPPDAKQDKNGVWRNSKGHPLKGQSMNPQGKPKDPKRAKFKEKAQKHSMEVLKMLIEVVRDTSARASDRIRAGEVLLDRAYGRPVTPPQEEGDKPVYQPQQIIIGDISKLTQVDQEITDAGDD